MAYVILGTASYKEIISSFCQIRISKKVGIFGFSAFGRQKCFDSIIMKCLGKPQGLKGYI